MIEIYIIYLFCKRLGRRLRTRGSSPFRWQLLLIFFWFLGEFVGSIFGTILAILAGNRDSYLGPAYLGAFVGALAAASFAFYIADRITKTKMANAANPAFPVEIAASQGPEERATVVNPNDVMR